MALQLDLQAPELNEEQKNTLATMRSRCARRILLATTLAASGHPGGSLSSLDMLLVLYGLMKHDPKSPRMEERDRFISSIGHISPGIYSVLNEYGYFSEEDFLTGFRRAGSGFPGHIESVAPGVEWDTGNLGQGLSTAVGVAQSFKAKKMNNRVVCLMGDGESQKGQVVEAIRYAHKYKLDNLTVLVDRNHLQICGKTEDIMPQSIGKLYESQGWDVVRLEDGHNYDQIFAAMQKALQNNSGRPLAIIARTVMGKGISFMENLAKYHGSPLSQDLLADALQELGVENDFAAWQEKRTHPVTTNTILPPRDTYPDIQPGEPIVYDADTMTDCRSAYGNALLSLAEKNNTSDIPCIVGVSCDLEGSVKMGGFHKHSPRGYFESGIQEHHAAAMSGAMSCENLVTFFSTFGVFAVSEAYNQNRLSDFNHTNVKIVATHVGLDVGEDGPTHQCIDYCGLLKNLFRFSVFMPADPNQCDRIIRKVATSPGNHFVGMGRSKTPAITREDGSVFYDADYTFTPGKADWLRQGNKATIITFGALTPACVDAWKILHDQGIEVGVLNMASLIPFDADSVLEAAAKGPLVTVEDHHVDTGLGASTALVLAGNGVSTPLKRMGVSRYSSSGKPADLYASQGLDAQSIAAAVKELLA